MLKIGIYEFYEGTKKWYFLHFLKGALLRDQRPFQQFNRVDSCTDHTNQRRKLKFGIYEFCKAIKKRYFLFFFKPIFKGTSLREPKTFLIIPVTPVNVHN